MLWFLFSCLMPYCVEILYIVCGAVYFDKIFNLLLNISMPLKCSTRPRCFTEINMCELIVSITSIATFRSLAVTEKSLTWCCKNRMWLLLMTAWYKQGSCVVGVNQMHHRIPLIRCSHILKASGWLWIACCTLITYPLGMGGRCKWFSHQSH